jgi:3-oxoacyl-[acyl-carrier-protein] synthase II
LINLAAGHISIEYGFKGPNHAAATACAAGANSIGDAMRFIQFGDADIMLAGGSEAAICRLALAGFSRLRALSTAHNKEPAKASRPFDDDRDGFVMGEGAGIMVLEELEHARKRGARIYAELVGYGLSSDAHHITAPAESGEGAQLSMQRALLRSGLEPKDIGYINAHATSTPLGDLIELRAIDRVFQNHTKHVKISSTKGALGHLLGASGAVEAILSVLALTNRIAPATLNMNSCKDHRHLNLVPLHPQDLETRAVLSNSFGFGGTNVSLIFKAV